VARKTYDATAHDSEKQEVTHKSLELAELLDTLTLRTVDTEDVESYSFAERSALANNNLVTFLNTEARGDMGSEVLVSLLVTGILGDEVEVLSADDQGAMHFGRNDGAGKNTAANGDETGKGALLVNVLTEDSSLGRLEA